ncbi:DUF992 domain-containing protein [Roseibium sp. RKSG952]|uniref:DUF992 domain-containing protein n=1 Tax=Roseibium sp. RKSG952 TaxID=2529384 RepID=UPI0012BB5B38|nr:DUF992 domain-containing protein [Roseibium sp. RKSG952]MTH99597.1 DUF992 domain-containing protein [Roseibium sp. RKSG952]
MNLKSLVAAGLILAPFATTAFADDKKPGVEIGVLSCRVEGESNFIVGSKHTLGCEFKPTSGAAQKYTGTVSEYGIDIGKVKHATLVWGVFAPSANTKPGALAGHYGGVAAGVSVGAGAQANVLVGGLDRSIALNPVSLQSETGANLTLGVSGMSLNYDG